MAKASLTTAPLEAGAQKKVQACKAKATCCTLLDLCPEDKAKVAKLIHQVVDLGKDLSQCKTKAAKDLQERTQHLRQRNAAVSQENHMLKAKLTHAFTLLRTYQHKIQALESASSPAAALQNAQSATATATAELQHKSDMRGGLHCSSELAANRPDSPSSDGVAAHGSSHVQHHIHLTQTPAPATTAKPSKYSRRQHGSPQHTNASVQQHAQHEASHRPVQPLQNNSRHSSAQHSALGGAFADLAAQTLALQHSDGAETASLPPGDPNDGKVLRFDPALGPDGGFYFVSWDSSQSAQHQPHVEAPPQDVRQVDQVQWERHSQCTAVESVCGEQDTLQDGFASSVQQVHQTDTTGVSSSTHEAASTVGQTSAMPTQSAAVPRSTDAAHIGLHANSAASKCQSGALSAVEASSTSAPAGPAAAVPAVVAAPTASVPFPVQGGGEAGMLLRAAAAAASGCSHQLVLAAAGRCDTETTRSKCSLSAWKSIVNKGGFAKLISPRMSSMDCHKDSQATHGIQMDSQAVMQQSAHPPTVSRSMHDPVASQADAQSAMLMPLSQPEPEQKPVSQSGQHTLVQQTAQQQTLTESSTVSVREPAVTRQPAQGCVTASAAPLPESPPQSQAAGPDAVDHNGDDELGFDSSLMDLVAEVEQMVTCNLHASQPAVHSSKSLVSTPVLRSQSLACHQQASAQQPAWLVAASGIQVGGYDGLFEENDVVSMISDQEYGAYQQY